MFCYQCEQTVNGTGCEKIGVCGKRPETAGLQDLLIHATKGIAQYAYRARKWGATNKTVDEFVLDTLFTTVTNVNFDNEAHLAVLKRADEVKIMAQTMYETAAQKAKAFVEKLPGPAAWKYIANATDTIRQAELVGVLSRKTKKNADITGTEDLILYGLKGAAAYAHHALMLGVTDNTIYAGFHETLNFLTEDHELEELLGEALRVGDLNYRVMEMLDRANTTAYGHPTPTKVRITPVKGKAILVTGHDLKDLEELLKQTAGKGINIYTHGEMLPAHGYPALKKYPHLVGNWGTAWQNQQAEFPLFPGAILFTTNCIQRPQEIY